MSTRRGTSNSNARGNTTDRERRREYLLHRFGDGRRAPCWHCRAQLTAKTITVDRIVPGCEGGRYVRSNVRPSCGTCNSRQGGRLAAQRRAA